MNAMIEILFLVWLDFYTNENHDFCSDTVFEN